MNASQGSRRSGFALIEALIALVIIGIGLLAISKLQSASLFGAGEAKSRAEAAHISQQKIEELRNLLRRGDLTGMASDTATLAGAQATYTLAWTISTPDAALDQRLVQLSTTWTDARGVAQRLDINSVVAWDDPFAQAGATKDRKGTLITPTGSAERGKGKVPAGATVARANPDGTLIYRDGSKTYLTQGDGTIILVLPHKSDGTERNFASITGRIWLGPNPSDKAIPEPENVRVRLSSEGECIFDGTKLISQGNYKYFTYTCYVGPGWYGNVGVTLVEVSGGNVGNANVCVGDPGFNGGQTNGQTTSLHSGLSTTRTYRGFRLVGGQFLSTGMQDGGRYGLSYDMDKDTKVVTEAIGPFDGWPRPSDHTAFYSVTAGTSLDYFNQDFLITAKLTGLTTCKDRMDAALFKRNGGQYICISPDADPASADQCSNKLIEVWPNFEVQQANGNCSNTISGSMADKFGSVEQHTPASPIYGTCKQEGKTLNYKCELIAPKGTTVKLRNYFVNNGNPSHPASYEVLSPELTLNCGLYSDPVNFTK